jgi:ABC-type amino acid transport substrate-binding protein
MEIFMKRRHHLRWPRTERRDAATVRTAWILAAGCLLVCLQAAAAGDLAAVKARGKLIMLCYPTQDSHFVAADLDVMRAQGLRLDDLRKAGHFKGLEVDLLNGFARSLGVELEIHAMTTGYDALLSALAGRQGDVAASELTITPKRRAIADFSQPYISGWLAVVTRRGSKIASAADLAGKKAAVVSGSSHLEFLLAAAPDVKIEPAAFDLESLEAVEAGRADFTLRDSNDLPGTGTDPRHPELKVAFRLVEFGNGVGLRKGSDLVGPLDTYLAGLARSGELARLLREHGLAANIPASKR